MVDLSRRSLLHGFGAASFSAMLSDARTSFGVSKMRHPIDWNSREDNVRAYLKTISDLSEKPTYRYHTGRILAVPKHRHLGEPFLDFCAIKQDRVRHVGDGLYQHAYRGVIIFRDLKTGKVIDRFDNPLTGQSNTVEHYKTSRGSIVYSPEGVFFLRVGGKATGLTPETDRPFRLPHEVVQDQAWLTYDERFSVDDLKSGKTLYADNSMYRYCVSLDELENPEVTSASMTMSWGTETKFWSWMQMDDHPGHLIFGSMGGKYETLNDLPQHIVSAAMERLPDHLDQCIKWTEYDL